MQQISTIFLDPADSIEEIDESGAYGFSIVPGGGLDENAVASPHNVYLALANGSMQAIAHTDSLIEVLVKIRTRAIRQAAKR